MKFNIKVERVRRRWFKNLRTKSELERYSKWCDEMATEHEKLAERCREISMRLMELENKK